MEGVSPKTRMRTLIRKYILERLQSDYLTFHQCSGISAALHREKEIPFAMCVQQLQNQTAQLINLEFIFHFIHIHVCMRTQSWFWGYAG